MKTNLKRLGEGKMWFRTEEAAKEYKASLIRRSIFTDIVASKHVSKQIADLLSIYFRNTFRRYFTQDMYFLYFNFPDIVVHSFSGRRVYKVSASTETKENVNAGELDIEEFTSHLSAAINKTPLLKGELFQIRIVKQLFTPYPVVSCPDYVTAPGNFCTVSDDNMMTVGTVFGLNESLDVRKDKVENRLPPCNIVTFSFDVPLLRIDSYHFGM